MKKTAFILFIIIFQINNSFSQLSNIGQTTITFNDPTRTGGFGSGGGPGRQIQTEIYYPAATSGTNTTPIAGQYPVIVFGHGFAMAWSAYQNIWEYLVPRGYIVAFPRTEGNLLSTNHQQFGWDLQFLVTEIQLRGSNPSSILFNIVAQETALMGHSMGGGAAFLAADSLCSNGNTNLKTLIGLAPAESSTNGVSSIGSAASITVPSVVFSGIQDGVTLPGQHHIPMYDALASDCKTRINIIGGAHCYFANSNTNCDFGESTSSSGISISRIQQQSVMNDFLNSWLAYSLKGDCNAFHVFNDSLNTSNRITFQQSCNKSSSRNESICQGDSMLIGNVYRYFSGAYNDTLVGSDGCDSIRTTFLNVNLRDTTEMNLSGCDSVNFNNNNYNSSGIYYQNYSNILGCDSILKLNISINNNTSIVFETACFSYTSNGQTFTNSGIYPLFFTNTQNCDSIVNLYLTIIPKDSVDIDVTACDSYIFNNVVYNTDGIYTQIFQNSNNCDSVVTLDLSLVSLDNTIVYDSINQTITANANGVNYQWINCVTNQNISGENNSNFTPTENGIYAVVVNNGVCEKTSNCINISTITSGNIFEFENKIKIYPNPNNGNFYIITNDGNLNIKTLKIIDFSGKIVFEKTEIQTNQLNIDISNLPNSIYFLEILEYSDVKRFKILKN
jgi:hypothetical protein